MAYDAKNLLESKVSGFIEKAALCYPDDEASKIAGKLTDACIIDEKRNFQGLVLEGTLLAANPNEKAKTLSFSPPTTSPGDKLRDALKTFVSSGLEVLPVVEKGKLQGVLKLSSILPKLPASEIALSEVVNKHPYSIGESSPVSDVREIMHRSRLGRVYVTDSAGHLVGIITHSSFLKKPSFFKKDWRRAAEIMEHGVVSVAPEDTVEKAVQKIAKNRLRAVALVEKGKLSGSVESSRIISKVLERNEPIGDGIYAQVSGISKLEPFEKAAINSVVQSSISKIAKSLGAGAKVKLVFKQGKSTWEIDLSCESKKAGNFRAKGTAFDAISGASEVLRTLEKQVRKGNL